LPNPKPSDTMSMEVAEIAAIALEEICNIRPSLTRVARLLNDGIAIKTTTSTAPIGLKVDGFWPKNCILSADRKHGLFGSITDPWGATNTPWLWRQSSGAFTTAVCAWHTMG